ncbi:Vacuolar protein sorting-associated protein Ist1 [Arabidopsis thaliana x Arabidopsis arenosa]|uniref:Vacuolar protein sorting-associated protein Ist1 n=1 Tax=Arabidopsis thaliana x Arabidopsis arenosa TaxID=1240361 RepID=A0A8T1Y327_9BRAS|nr:Vacuolar protein sorting-associated protein Ist1 [Arabidopsis thaliana x Arabidopsis arenosa]
MKKVLHRSFKPAKCKIALQMAASRLKILKNKKDTQIKQLRRELAQLLESGQTQTAKIRVEHVVREEKTVAAYELVGIYCELLVARLGVIDSQKTCPNDLKEAVTSVLYASQRLTDVAELSDIVKHFSAKYGKDFVSAAIGLQPDSGVSRLLVEKLSVKAPDGPTKIKILTEIATQHNVTWEAESLVESDPKETVLASGASSSQSQSATGIKPESSRIRNNQPPEFQAPATVSVSQNSYESDGRSSSRMTSTDFNVGKTADHYHQDPKPSGDRTDGREHRHHNPGHGDSSPFETEFVDATSAARAAAESAERASFAARAAAELSSKERMMAMQNSKESRNSSSYDNLRNNPPHSRTSSSNVQSGGFAKEELLRSSNRQEDQSTTRAESSKKTVDELSENASRRRDHSPENSLEMRPNDSFARIGREKQQPSMNDINRSSSEDVLNKKQSSRASSHSPSSNFSDDNGVTALDHIDSSSILEENRFQSTIGDIESYNDGPDVVVAPVFDDYSSFFDKPQFDTEDACHDEPEQGLGFSLLGSSSKTSDHMPIETSSWSFEGHNALRQSSSASTSQVLEKEKPSSPIFDDGPTSPPASLHEPEPSAKFDDYDQDSESEEDNLKNKGNISGHVEEKPKLKSQKSQMSEAPDDLGRYFFPSDTEDQGDDSKIQEESDTENETTLPSYGMSPPKEKTWSKSVKEHVPTEVDPSRSSSFQTDRTELYTQKASNMDKRPSSIPPDSSSSDDESEIKLRERVSARYQDKRAESRTRSTHLHSRVSHEDLKDKIPTRASTRSQERRTHKTTPASASASYFHVISSDDEDEKEVYRDAARTQTKPSISISRRTKGQERRSSLVTAKTETVSHDQESPPKPSPEAKPLAKQQVSASFSSYLPKTDKASHDHESPPKLSTEAKPLAKQQGSASSLSFLPKTDKASHDQESTPKLGLKAKPAAKQQGSATSSSSLPKTEKVSHYRESPPKPTSEAKSLAKQVGLASSSSSLPKTVTSPDPETPAKEKASHVHPKLPDYDDIFAKLGALRR